MDMTIKARKTKSPYDIRNMSIDDVIEYASQLARNELSWLKDDEPITSSGRLYRLIKASLATTHEEIFKVVFMNNQHEVISVEDMFRGTINSCSVYPRTIIKRALELNAAAIAIAHNHPSGIAEFSQSDLDITKRIATACKLVDIRLLDHVLVHGWDYTIMSETYPSYLVGRDD